MERHAVPARDAEEPVLLVEVGEDVDVPQHLGVDVRRQRGANVRRKRFDQVVEVAVPAPVEHRRRQRGDVAAQFPRNVELPER